MSVVSRLARSARKCAAILAVAISASAASTTSAALIQMNFSFTASGTLNGVAFNDALVSITLTGNSIFRGNYQDGPWTGYYIADTSLPSQRTFSIAGLGGGTVNSVLSTMSYGLGPFNYRALQLGPVTANQNRIMSIDAGSAAWDMTSGESPVTGNTAYGAGFVPPGITTELGTLQFSSVSGLGTFSASTVPAPAAVALLGLAGLAKRRRR